MSIRFRSDPIAYRSVPYIGVLFLLGVLQVSFFSILDPFGSPPDILLGAVVALAMLEDARICAVSGIASGLFYCALGGSSPAYIIFSFICACLMSYVCSRFPKKNYPAFLALCALAYCFKAAFNVADATLGSNALGILGALRYAALPELASSMLLCSVSYLAMKPLIARLNNKQKIKKGSHKNEQ